MFEKKHVKIFSKMFRAFSFSKDSMVSLYQRFSFPIPLHLSWTSWMSWRYCFLAITSAFIVYVLSCGEVDLSKEPSPRSLGMKDIHDIASNEHLMAFDSKSASVGWPESGPASDLVSDLVSDDEARGSHKTYKNNQAAEYDTGAFFKPSPMVLESKKKEVKPLVQGVMPRVMDDDRVVRNTVSSADATPRSVLEKAKVVLHGTIEQEPQMAMNSAEVGDVSEEDFAAELEVEITGVRLRRGGEVCVSVFAHEADFLNDDRVITGRCMSSLDKSFKVLLPKSGYYALAVLHDTDSSRDLSTNFFGIPKEGFGFSRNPVVRFGPPSFEDTRLLVNKTQKIVISMKYFF